MHRPPQASEGDYPSVAPPRESVLLARDERASAIALSSRDWLTGAPSSPVPARRAGIVSVVCTVSLSFGGDLRAISEPAPSPTGGVAALSPTHPVACPVTH